MRETPARVSLRTATAPARLLLILLLLLGAAPAFGASDRGGEKSGSVKVRVAGAVAERSVAAAGGTLVARYESFSVWRIASARARALALRTEAVEVLENANEILLNTGALDTASAGTMALRRSVGSFSGKRLHLVQFAGPVQPEWYASLVATGVQVVQPIPSNAYLVWGDASAIGRAQSMAQSSSVVQWDGAYEPEYKIQPSARALGKSAARDMKAGDAGLDLYQVQLVKDDETNAATFQAVSSIQTSAVRQQYEILSYVNFVVGLNAAFVKDLAARPDVVSIAKWTEPKKLDERADLIMAGQLTGNAPTATDYLAYLAGKGFTRASSRRRISPWMSRTAASTTRPRRPNHFAPRLARRPDASRTAASSTTGWWARRTPAARCRAATATAT